LKFDQPFSLESQLREAGIFPSPQRLAVASVVLHTDAHPSAEQVMEQIAGLDHHVSRATVYNTLNLFVQKRLLQELVIREGQLVFDPNVEPHHHFFDQSSGEIFDLSSEEVSISLGERAHEKLSRFAIEDIQIVIRGRCKSSLAPCPPLESAN